MSEVFWVISNFNQDPSEILKEIGDEFIIYNQGEERYLPESLLGSDKLIDSLHSGHNISDYLRYIIDNYKNLPKRVGLIKGNIFPRHIDKNTFIERIKINGFVPLYSELETFKPDYIIPIKSNFLLMAQQFAPGYFMEKTTNWYCKTKDIGSFFPKLEDFFLYFFKKDLPLFIPFTPGACMIVPKENILRWSIDTYKELYEIVTYRFFPVEAYHAERCMLYFFNFPRE